MVGLSSKDKIFIAVLIPRLGISEMVARHILVIQSQNFDSETKLNPVSRGFDSGTRAPGTSGSIKFYRTFQVSPIYTQGVFFNTVND